MNRNYADQCEEDDFILLTQFNEKLKLRNLGKTPYMHPTDASAYTKDNKYIEIELKKRHIDINAYSSIIIEPYKLQYAQEHANSIQLYVNFINDDYVIVFNLHKIKQPRKSTYNIPSKLYERVKESARYELPMENAWIYQKQNNQYALIRKGS